MNATDVEATAIAIRRKKRKLLLEIFAYLSPVIIIVAVFVFAPLTIILFYSFLKSGPFGEIVYSFSLENFRAILGGGYGIVYLKSIYLAFQTNLLCIIIGYPIAYYMAMFGGRWKTILLFLVIVPSWASYLIRLYSLKTIIGSKGLVNSLLLNLDIISSPLEILYTPFAVMLGLVYAWLPYMILPIYAAIEGLDRSVLEAAVDLGATPVRRFFRITLPMTKGGLLAGSILVFIPTVGEWLVPHIFGGSKVMMAGSLVALKFTSVGNIPAGASLAIMLAATLILILYLTIKWGGREAMERML
ncbi:Spermidine/putrescine import ABC transporter permease protein PotB (TC 3.A.1.11.1) [Olavius algarvensis Delta 1 endosymbiont]|nr:Spermidine/putrescine import ABC transporter permease protein PotB (TC 3.A.1.11.1) [Olavius algarvensis Delta 1 endosymbiont]